jgi:hypothetical protein
VAADKPESSDATTIALLKWIFAGLLLLNGAALLIAAMGQGGSGALLRGFRWNYAAGLACALAGGLCWLLSHGAIPREDREDDSNRSRFDPRGARDQAIAFGAIAIMFWVASLTTFVIGCEHLSWSPGGDRTQRLLHSTAVADRHRSVAS